MTKEDKNRVAEFLTALEGSVKRATQLYWEKGTDLLDGPTTDVCGLCCKFEALEKEQDEHISKLFSDVKTFIESLDRVESGLTNEELERLVLPLEWMDDEDDYGNPAISASYGQYEALIKVVSGGMCTLQIRVYGNDDALYTRIGLTMEEAKATAREFQVDYVRSQLVTTEE